MCIIFLALFLIQSLCTRRNYFRIGLFVLKYSSHKKDVNCQADAEYCNSRHVSSVTGEWDSCTLLSVEVLKSPLVSLCQPFNVHFSNITSALFCKSGIISCSSWTVTVRSKVEVCRGIWTHGSTSDPKVLGTNGCYPTEAGEGNMRPVMFESVPTGDFVARCPPDWKRLCTILKFVSLYK